MSKIRDEAERALALEPYTKRIDWTAFSSENLRNIARSIRYEIDHEEDDPEELRQELAGIEAALHARGESL